MERNYEGNLFGSLIQPQSITGTLYNGAAATTAAGTGLDTAGYDGITIILNSGTFTGDGALDVTVVTSATDDSTSTAAVASAVFTQITTANHQAMYKGYVKVHAQNRYLWLKSVKGGSGAALISASYAMDRNPKHPELARASLAFVIDQSV